MTEGWIMVMFMVVIGVSFGKYTVRAYRDHGTLSGLPGAAVPIVVWLGLGLVDEFTDIDETVETVAFIVTAALTFAAGMLLGQG